jgi:putative transcriptional regulator
MFGLGKKRSNLGKWLDRRGISQRWLEKSAAVSKGTVSRLCSEPAAKPSGNTASKILKALKKVDPGVKYDQFWM